MNSTTAARTNHSSILAARARALRAFREGDRAEVLEQVQALQEPMHAPRRPGERAASAPIVHGGLDAATMMSRLASAHQEMNAQREAVAKRIAMSKGIPSRPPSQTDVSIMPIAGEPKVAPLPATPAASAAPAAPAAPAAAAAPTAPATPKPTTVKPPASKDPASFINPYDPAIQRAKNEIARELDPQKRFGRDGEIRSFGSPWTGLSKMSIEELDKKITTEFLKRSSYVKDRNGDNWAKVGEGSSLHQPRGRDAWERAERNPVTFKGDCEDLSFKLASVMQAAHQDYYRAKGMSRKNAAAKAAADISIVGTKDHMVVGVRAKGGETTLHEAVGPVEPVKINLDREGAEQGYTYQSSKPGSMKLFDPSFDINKYEPNGMVDAISDAVDAVIGHLAPGPLEGRVEALTAIVQGRLQGFEALTPSSTGHLAVVEAVVAPLGLSQAVEAVMGFVNSVNNSNIPGAIGTVAAWGGLEPGSPTGSAPGTGGGRGGEGETCSDGHGGMGGV